MSDYRPSEIGAERETGRVVAHLPQTAPDDTYNRQLVEQVRPSDWQNPKPQGRYNLIVLGAGTAGLVTAAGAAGLGARVALIERDLLGGDCLNVGCVPSKALLAAARPLRTARRAAQWMRQAVPLEPEFDRVMERMRRLRASISPHDSAARFRELGVDVFFGAGKFVSANAVEVAGQRLDFHKAVIATGGRAAAPPIAGLDQVRYRTNETLFSLDDLPKRLGIVGAGPIGCEMAQAFANFGSQVTLVEADHGVLPREQRDAAAVIEQSLREDSVELLCCGKNLVVQRRGEAILLAVDSHNRSWQQPVDELLIAAGRAPNVEGLDLEVAGVEYDVRQGIHVDDHLRTTNPHIFAAGDVCSHYKFTHAADFMARIVIQNALFFGRAKLSRLVIPWCTYTMPELAHVGLDPEQADRRGVAISTYEQPLRGVDRAVLEGETDGFVRIHVKRGTGTIVGATIVATHAGEMISLITLAMNQGIGLKQIAASIHPYPTLSEAIRKIGDQYNRTRLTPTIKKIMHTWLAWRR